MNLTNTIEQAYDYPTASHYAVRIGLLINYESIGSHLKGFFCACYISMAGYTGVPSGAPLSRKAASPILCSLPPISDWTQLVVVIHTNYEVIIMSAQILYFPSNGRTFQSTPQDYPITFNQVEEIREQSRWSAKIFKDNSELVTKHIYNKLRVTFCVQRLEDIPQQHYEEALSLIEQAREELWDFNGFIQDLQKLFAINILKNGDPWTPNTKTKWRKNLAKQLPERPDWRALAREIEGSTS